MILIVLIVKCIFLSNLRSIPCFVGDQPFGFTDVSTEECSDWPAKGKYVKALVASNNRVLESELTCGDAKQFAYRLGSPVRQRGGYREDEGRSRRRF